MTAATVVVTGKIPAPAIELLAAAGHRLVAWDGDAPIERDELLQHVATVGERLRAGLAADPRVTQVRGEGLLIGIELSTACAAEVFTAALEAGFIVNNPTPTAIRLAPPLVLTEADADAFVAAWPAILDTATGAGQAGESAGESP